MAPYEARIGPLQGLGLVRTPTAYMIRLRRQFRYDSHIVRIRWFIGVIGLLHRLLSFFKSCELIQYLAIAVMR